MSELSKVLDVVAPVSAGYLAGSYVAAQAPIIIAEVASVVVTRTALQVGAQTIVTPFATAAATGTAVVLNPIVAGVVVGFAVYTLFDALFGEKK
jgi:hypothetical protein